MPLLSVCCRDMPCVRIDLFIGKDPERVLNGFIPETGQRFTHDYLHRSAANSPCSIENAITYSVLLFYFKSVPEGSFFMNKKLAAIVLAAVLAGSMIAGCGSSSGGGTASSGSGEPAAAEAEAETGGETEEETQTVDAIDTSAAAVEDVAETAASVEAATTVSEAASTAASSAAETAVETDPVAQAAALIDAIYVQERTETTDADIEAARNAWNALTDEQKALVEGEDADPDYFGRDTGDASLDDPRNGDEIGENELLVVSFGTSFNESRAEDIGGIEKALQEANPDWSVRRAFTAQIIINHVQARDEEVIDNVDQALARAKANGVKNLVVQPTHLMHGAEYDELMAALKAVEGDFETIRVAEPLLGQVGEDASVINEDKAIVAQAVAATAAAEAGYEGEDTAAALAAAAEDGTAFVFMGHGTAHVAKVSYSQMQTQMNELGYNNVFIGTVEGEPEETACDQIIEKVKAAGFKKVILRPLMVVAGDHANNDMAGDEEDSWKSMFMADGSFDQVDCQVEGLGRIPEIQALYAAHTAAALASDPTAGTAVSGAAEDAGAALEDGTYTATFTTDGSMFHVNEAYDNKGTLTVADGQMTIHVSLVSKKIVNLFLGTAEEAQAEGAALLEPTTDSVEYADGTTDEVYGFDIPVPAIGEEFDCALVGEKGKWYDHKVMVTDPVKAE
ncbi:Cobalamin biosynthesis protein CbiK, Co2+ chelatase [Sarcina sp. DSM 11001]|nr:Cobalamin biosynthesis protein CbiK, Co2+ chelatase [Sarcina sp. DSM 11001]